jgi:uncharacterized membrane protein HdeD (DUF308 family)
VDVQIALVAEQAHKVLRGTAGHSFNVGRQRVRQNWGWFLALGIGLGILGIIALGATVTTTVVSTVILGVVILTGGLVVIASAFTAGGGVGGAILRGALGVLLLSSWRARI